MKEQFDVQQLILLSKRWPWKWFGVFQKAGQLAEEQIVLRTQEYERFRAETNVLNAQNQLLRLEGDELRKHRNADAAERQALMDDNRSLKFQLEAERVQANKQRQEDLQREKLLQLEVEQLRQERQSLSLRAKQAIEGATTLFEFIRRNKVRDFTGREIPKLTISMRK